MDVDALSTAFQQHIIYILDLGNLCVAKFSKTDVSALVAPRSSEVIWAPTESFFKAWNLLHSRSTEIRTCLCWDDTEFMAQLQQLTPMKPFSNLKPRFWVFS